MAMVKERRVKDQIRLAVRRVFGILQLAVLVLELAGVIDWHWTRVFAPTWMCVIAVLLVDFGAAVVKVRRQLKEEEEQEKE